MAGTVLLIVTSGFNDMAYLASQVVLEEAGHDVITASKSNDAIKGQESSVMTVSLSEALEQGITYKMAVIIGGQDIENWDLLTQTIQQFHSENIVIGAIGNGIQALKLAGIAAQFSEDESVKDDNNIVSVLNTDSAETFAEYLVGKL